METDGCWSGLVYPNASTTTPPCNSTDCANGCLFQIFNDPTEHVNLVEDMPAKATEMRALLAQLNKGYFNPDRGQPDVRACDRAMQNGNFWGPFLP